MLFQIIRSGAMSFMSKSISNFIFTTLDRTQRGFPLITVKKIPYITYHRIITSSFRIHQICNPFIIRLNNNFLLSFFLNPTQTS
ncbi:hypothetical protein QL285_053620 [Trifolium repens]|nr:hypothetical protein QL285_053620 [Trifolium repens]